MYGSGLPLITQNSQPYQPQWSQSKYHEPLFQQQFHFAQNPAFYPTEDDAPSVRQSSNIYTPSMSNIFHGFNPFQPAPFETNPNYMKNYTTQHIFPPIHHANSIYTLPVSGDCLPSCVQCLRRQQSRDANTWLRRLFLCLVTCCRSKKKKSRQWCPSESRLRYLKRVREIKKGSFSRRFISETKSAETESRLDINTLVKNTEIGLFTEASLDSLELELLERSNKNSETKFGDVDFIMRDSHWKGSHPIYFGIPYSMNSHNSRLQSDLSRSSPCISCT